MLRRPEGQLGPVGCEETVVAARGLPVGIIEKTKGHTRNT